LLSVLVALHQYTLRGFANAHAYFFHITPVMSYKTGICKRWYAYRWWCGKLFDNYNLLS